MPILPVPSSPAHIQALKGSGASAPAASDSAVTGNAAESGEGVFGTVLEGQIKGLAATLKSVKNAGLKDDDTKGSADASKAIADITAGQDGSKAADVSMLFPAVTPIPVEAVQADAQGLAAGVQSVKPEIKGVENRSAVTIQAEKTAGKVNLTDAKDTNSGQNGNDGAAEIAGGGKLFQVAEAAKVAQAAGMDTKPAVLAPVPSDQQLRPDSSAALSVAQMPAQPAQTGPAAVVEPRVGAPGWDAALGQKIAWVATQSQQSAELHLNPPHLGPLEVRLTVTNDQTSALFISHQPAVRDALESALPRLREMLADNGLTLGNVTVSSQSFSQQQSFPGSGDDRPAWHGGSPSVASGDVPAISGTGTVAKTWRNGMVDTFA